MNQKIPNDRPDYLKSELIPSDRQVLITRITVWLGVLVLMAFYAFCCTRAYADDRTLAASAVTWGEVSIARHNMSRLQKVAVTSMLNGIGKGTALASREAESCIWAFTPEKLDELPVVIANVEQAYDELGQPVDLYWNEPFDVAFVFIIRAYCLDDTVWEET